MNAKEMDWVELSFHERLWKLLLGSDRPQMPVAFVAIADEWLKELDNKRGSIMIAFLEAPHWPYDPHKISRQLDLRIEKTGRRISGERVRQLREQCLLHFRRYLFMEKKELFS